MAGKSLGSNLRLTWGINKQIFVLFPGEENSVFWFFFLELAAHPYVYLVPARHCIFNIDYDTSFVTQMK